MASSKICSFVTLIGMVSVSDDGEGSISGVYLPSQNLPVMNDGTSEVLDEAMAQINEYLSGKRRTFNLPMSYSGTDFFCRVLECMSEIPYGETCTYGELANLANHPNAYRAVGSVCSGNPLPILIPCHRVIPSSGGIGSYGGGSILKKHLLGLEKSNPNLTMF